jgi:hypothetical protein
MPDKKQGLFHMLRLYTFSILLKMPPEMQTPAPKMPGAAHKDAEKQEQTLYIEAQSFQRLPPNLADCLLTPPLCQAIIVLPEGPDQLSQVFLLYQASSFCRKPCSLRITRCNQSSLRE